MNDIKLKLRIYKGIVLEIVIPIQLLYVIIGLTAAQIGVTSKIFPVI